MGDADDPYIVSEGYPFIAAAAFLALFAAASGLPLLAGCLLVATLAVAAFFRNPYRRIPEDPEAIVCPADGKVLEIRRTDADGLLPAPCWKISIFMSPLNVHVNRIPAAGKVLRKAHRPGRFYVASRPKASEENERTELILETEPGVRVGVVQIAGRMARRIVCYPTEGSHVDRGERYGLIRFGSRVELYLPETVAVAVREGQRVKGGETVMGHFP